MGPQRPAVGHGEERDADLATVFVHGALDVDADGRRALVQDGELGLVVEQPRHLPQTARNRSVLTKTLSRSIQHPRSRTRHHVHGKNGNAVDDDKVQSRATATRHCETGLDWIRTEQSSENQF